jgi:hypothetical protein
MAYAGFVLLLSTLAWVKPLGYSFAPWTFHHVLAPLLVISSSFGLAGVMLTRAAVSPRWQRVWAGCASVLAVVGTVWLVLGHEDATYVDSPAGKDLRVVIKEGFTFLDPQWIVSIRHTVGFGLVRDREVACLDGDDPNNTLRGVAWLSADSIRINTDGAGSPEVRISSSGRPERIVRLGAACGG